MNNADATCKSLFGLFGVIEKSFATITIPFYLVLMMAIIMIMITMMIKTLILILMIE